MTRVVRQAPSFRYAPTDEVDFAIVGAGAAGGVMARELSRDGYRVGTTPPSFDKQYVRDYLETLAWDKTPPAPVLPAEVVQRTREKYVEALARLTGQDIPLPTT